jgi:cytochrome c-type biogenesis protein CcmH/NrfG
VQANNHVQLKSKGRRSVSIHQNINPDVQQLKFLCEAGSFFLSKSRMAEACDIFRGVIALAPERAIGHTLLGDALMNWEKFDEAVTAHLKALELEPDNTFARVHYAQALLFKKQKDKAVAELRKVLEKDPNGPDGTLAKHLLKGVDQGLFSRL